VAAAVALVGAVMAAGGGAAGAAPLTRQADPVVVPGASLPTLSTFGKALIVGFAYDGSAWKHIPIQIDERALVDLGKVYNQLAFPNYPTPNGVKVLTYTAGNTFTGNDPNKKLDADDELVFMARDAGVVAPTGALPTGVVPGSGVEIHVTDPLAPGSEGFVYLFRKAKGAKLPQGAKVKYVKYNFKLLSGNYKKTYKITQGPNPENTTVKGATYEHHFGDRWMSDSLKVTAPGASRVDILDRHKALFAPGVCGRSEDTFNAAEGAFVINKAGPVRALRSYIGANSGPSTQRTHLFYDQREDIVTDLRVHAIPSIMDVMDYSAAASGMTYRNSLNPTGVTVDGSPDSVTAGAPTWEQVTGPQGSVTTVAQLLTSFTPSGLTSYYLDSVTPPVTQCTGDASAYGTSGLSITGAIPCTDPFTACTQTLQGVRTMYFESPGATAATAEARTDQVLTPLAVTATPRP
jgi:hypothetical protein